MIDSAPQEVPPLFPRFLAGGPEQLRLAPASVAIMVGCGALLQVASSGILGRQTQDGWPVLSESAAATIAGALLTAALATRWLGRPLGLAAGLLQLSCLYTLGLPAEPNALGSFVTVLAMAAMAIFARANVPGRLPVDAGLRMQVFFYGCAAGLLLLSGGWVALAGVLLACLIYLLLNQDGRAFRFLAHPLGLGVAAILAAGAIWLRHSAAPSLITHMVGSLAPDPPAWPTPAAQWRWLAALAVGMLPWWPFAVLAVVAGCRRGDYATAFWQLVACWSLLPMALAALGLLGGRGVLAMTCGPLSVFSAAGLHEAVRWWRAGNRR